MPTGLQEHRTAVFQEQTVEPELAEECRGQLKKEENQEWQEIVTAHSG